MDLLSNYQKKSVIDGEMELRRLIEVQRKFLALDDDDHVCADTRLSIVGFYS